ncbi:MAG: hypothetical protein EA382_06025 [Spirochaetaceae bacterium]|nr:MAG: hypothetical protein EA382_06025 [Spirochaetaceae bacterium]
MSIAGSIAGSIAARIAARIALICAAWVAIQIGSGYLTHAMPLRWFIRDNALFRTRRFERGGRLYRLFGVHRWKDRLPEAGALFAGGFSKSRLAAGTRAPGAGTAGAVDPSGDRVALLERFVAETRRAELTHWLPVVASFTFFLWNPPEIAAWMPPIGLVGNLPFIIVQRSNRPRLEAAIETVRTASRRRTQPSAGEPDRTGAGSSDGRAPGCS